jgi:hypothetical protein
MGRALTKRALTKRALTKGALTKRALTKGALTKGALTKGAGHRRNVLRLFSVWVTRTEASSELSEVIKPVEGGREPVVGQSTLCASLGVLLPPDSVVLHPRLARRGLQLGPSGQVQVSLHLVHRDRFRSLFT